MIKKFVIYLFMAMVLLCFIAMTHAADSVQTHTDDFNGPALDAGWRWIREDKANWNFSLKPGYISLLSTGSDLYDGTPPNILLWSGTAGNWTAVTRIEVDPKLSYQQAGFIVYQDDKNYIKNVFSIDGYQCYDLAKCQDGKFILKKKPGKSRYVYKMEDTGVELKIENGYKGSVYLKVEKIGSVYNLSSSDDNSTWTLLQIYSDVNFVSPKIGFVCMNAKGLQADIDWFDYKSLP